MSGLPNQLGSLIGQYIDDSGMVSTYLALPHSATIAAGAALGRSQLGAADAEEPNNWLSKKDSSKIDEKAVAVLTSRRNKRVPVGLATAEDIAAIKEDACYNAIHSTGTPGITAFDVQGDLVLTGGADKTVALFNVATEQVAASFKGHTKKINGVCLHRDGKTAVSCSADSDVRVWNSSEEKSRHLIGKHEDSVTGIALHATGDFILSVSDDGHWAFSDINVGKTLCKVRGDESGQCTVQFRPDGSGFGIGSTDAVVKIWDLRTQKAVIPFPRVHSGAVRAIAFSETGPHYLASGAADGEVKLWDLRKLSCVQTVAIRDGKSPVNDIFFDESGTYLGVAANDVSVIHVKQWNIISSYEVARRSSASQAVTGVRFGPNALSIFSAGMDKTLRIYRK